MRPSLLSLVSATAFALTLAVSGCATDDNAPGTSGTSADAAHQGHGSAMGMAMMCPKCETVWTRAPGPSNPSRVHAYSSKRAMACPTCDKAARTQLMGDGQPMMHDCPECKAKMVPMTPATGSTGPTGGRQSN